MYKFFFNSYGIIIIIIPIIICIFIVYYFGFSNFILVFTGATLSVLIVLIIDHLRFSKDSERRDRTYKPFEGRYCIHKKDYNAKIKGFQVLGHIDIFYHKGIFKIKGIVLNKHEDFVGEFSFDNNSVNFGKGWYHHKQNENGYIAFGFWNVIFYNEKTLLIDSQYSSGSSIIGQPVIGRKVENQEILDLSLDELKKNSMEIICNEEELKLFSQKL